MVQTNFPYSVAVVEGLGLSRDNISPVGLKLPANFTSENWSELGRRLQTFESSSKWWLGDWLRDGEKYGETYKRAVNEGFVYGTAANLVSIAKKFEISRRRENLTWSHHAVVAALEAADADRLLAQAEAESWSVKRLRAAVRREVSQDAIPEPPVNPVAKLGDLYRMGKHRLLCGNSTIPADVARLMGDERAILFATDPPYGVNYKGGSHPVTRANRGKANRNKDWSKVYREAGTTAFENEDGDPDKWRSFYLSFYRVAVSHAIAPNAAWYCWHASTRHTMLEAVWNEVGAFEAQPIIWVKSAPVLTYSPYMWGHEPCMHGWIKGHKPLVNHRQGGYTSTAWQVPSAEIESKDHPTCKPNRLFAIPMELNTHPGNLCYEPFSGSGSQIIAAEQLGRRCYAMEIEPRFVDVAIARWEAMTKKKAVLVAADESAVAA